VRVLRGTNARWWFVGKHYLLKLHSAQSMMLSMMSGVVGLVLGRTKTAAQESAQPTATADA
jgi:hypothetical protein